jgi:hypothetical protein
VFQLLSFSLATDNHGPEGNLWHQARYDIHVYNGNLSQLGCNAKLCVVADGGRTWVAKGINYQVIFRCSKIGWIHFRAAKNPGALINSIILDSFFRRK